MILKHLSRLLFFMLLFSSCDVNAASKLINDLPFSVQYFRDKSSTEKITSVVNEKFTNFEGDIFNFGPDKSTFWIKFKTERFQNFLNKVLFIDQSRLSSAKMYIVDSNGDIKPQLPYNLFETKNIKFSQGKIYNLPNAFNKENTIYLQLTAHETFLTRINVIREDTLLESFSLKDVIFGIYTGIMVIMFIYNLFLFIIIRDSSYLYYVFYILFVWFTQISIQGFATKYFWDEGGIIDHYSVVFFSTIGLTVASLFTISFLNTKVFSTRLHRLIIAYIILTLLNICVLIIFDTYISFISMQLLTLVGAVLATYASYFVYFKRHFKPAGYYLIAWSILIVGAMLFVLKDYGIIPYNNFTVYLMQISSAIEVMLLSFALADKINFFKKENEIAQAQALNASLENQKLIKEQNIVLEKRVQERTEELQNANSTLNITLTNLKDTQSQLVDAEKMAALGQLTAGIAHEINNPINFVTSNIKPLQLDIDDLKEIITKYEELDFEREIAPQIAEIEAFKEQIDIDYVNKEITSLLSGISEGAKRTAEIIRSLRNFSRLDESDMKPIDLNEGLDSTLVLVRNNIPDNVTVVKDLGNLPKVECQAGKINQVFMNLVSNAIQAIKSKENKAEEEFIIIKSWYIDQQVKVSIKDTGTGMTPEVKHRIFEPFFTTKDIGEGTGLGLSIVFSIIENHKGHIEVNSKVGEGTEFIITLNINL